MSCVKSFYDHWMLRYSTKRIFLIFNLKFELELSDQISFDWIEFELIWFWSDSNWSELIWSVQNFFELNLNCRSDIFDLIWSDRSDSNQIQSDQFFLGALTEILSSFIILLYQQWKRCTDHQRKGSSISVQLGWELYWSIEILES